MGRDQHSWRSGGTVAVGLCPVTGTQCPCVVLGQTDRPGTGQSMVMERLFPTLTCELPSTYMAHRGARCGFYTFHKTQPPELTGHSSLKSKYLGTNILNTA